MTMLKEKLEKVEALSCKDIQGVQEEKKQWFEKLFSESESEKNEFDARLELLEYEALLYNRELYS
jgi:hypothetical protein